PAFGLHLSVAIWAEIANAAKATALYDRGWLNPLRSNELVRLAFGFGWIRRRPEMGNDLVGLRLCRTS
ncbi:MAG TPA: hypothetical protein VHS80_10255, partial [Chthoniobacterales bacterium]|nr:hypothetical protein [Chthoniobacterales bacterium]